ncbi:MAG TPA: ferric reductase-like transmembrane domain-containing protein [Candidatus Saccharimonadales bacterium]|nr:ferric reductase-like transmembrane domain-containing protein [Candidatus Saccharimonadales bacterium]
MAFETTRARFYRLLGNSRFWILAGGIVLSCNIAGVIQLLVPDSTAQIMLTSQCYGFLALGLLYLALLASPLTKVYPDLFFQAFYLHARRAVGVLAFYYAFLHAYLGFFKQLDGFAGISHLDSNFTAALLLGVFSLAILSVLTATSLDWVVKTMGFKRWKLLQRLVYLASVATLIHIVLIGTLYSGVNLASTLTAVAVIVLLWLEAIRIRNRRQGKRS